VGCLSGFLRQPATPSNNAAELTAVCLTFGVFNLLLFLYNGTVWSIYAPFAARMEGKLRRNLFRKIISLPHGRIEATPDGEWITRLNADTEAPFSRAVHLPHAACALVNIAASSFLLWKMNPAAVHGTSAASEAVSAVFGAAGPSGTALGAFGAFGPSGAALFGCVLLFVLPHIAVSQWCVARVMPTLTLKSLEATAKNTGELTSFITCADTIVLYGGQDYLMKRFEQSSRDLWKANMKIRAREAINSGILPLFGLGGYLALLILSAGWIADGSFTFGDLAAAFQYRGGVLAGSMMLINCLISIKGSMAGIRRINGLMAEGTDIAGYRRGNI
jgi:ABC-type multidrug transport system fused ATPase/permease subunit